MPPKDKPGQFAVRNGDAIADARRAEPLALEQYVEHIAFVQPGIHGRAPGDWALGDLWGPTASETRAWLDYLTTGKPCVIATPAEARTTLETTLAIELSSHSGRQVQLPMSG